MPTAKAQREVDISYGRIQVATRSNDHALFRYDKGTVKLRQFLYGSAQIRVGDMSSGRCMAYQRVENQWSRGGENGIGSPERLGGQLNTGH